MGDQESAHARKLPPHVLTKKSKKHRQDATPGENEQRGIVNTFLTHSEKDQGN